MPALRRLHSFAAVALAVLLVTAGCSAHRHTVGSGPQGLGQSSARQYYILFGLFRLNEVNSQDLAADRTTYEIVSDKSLVDIVLFPLLLPFTVTTRTVTVYR